MTSDSKFISLGKDILSRLRVSFLYPLFILEHAAHYNIVLYFVHLLFKKRKHQNYIGVSLSRDTYITGGLFAGAFAYELYISWVTIQFYLLHYTVVAVLFLVGLFVVQSHIFVPVLYAMYWLLLHIYRGFYAIINLIWK